MIPQPGYSPSDLFMQQNSGFGNQVSMSPGSLRQPSYGYDKPQQPTDTPGPEFSGLEGFIGNPNDVKKEDAFENESFKLED